jgi:hypothetical protein
VDEVSSRRQADSEPAAPSQAAASQNQVPVPFAVPAADAGGGRGSGCLLATRPALLPTPVEQEMDLCIRSMLAKGFRPWQIGQVLKLRQRYGISVRAISRYVAQLPAADPLPAGGLVHRVGRPHAMDAGTTQRLLGTLTRQALHSLSCQLQDPQLTPEQLSRLLVALAHQRQVMIKAQAQSIASDRYTRERLLQKRQDKRQKEQERKAIAKRKELRTLLGKDSKLVPDAVLDTIDNLSTLGMVARLVPGQQTPSPKRSTRSSRKRR